jgi:non-canonical (house-cleaning) NTP pyrophosphatase/8-oxo-dGTP pyrophosphatase MutT (NUDIX family)
MKVIIGSNNKDKIKIVKDALGELHLDVEAEGRKADSGITDQPLDKDTTKEGAINRAKNAKQKNPDADFWIGLEGGLHPTSYEASLRASGYHPSSKDYGVASVEGYHLVTYACLIDRDENKFIGEGEEIHLPIKVSEKVKNGELFGDVIREYAKDNKIDENLITRLAPFTRAVQSAYVEYLKVYENLGYRKKVSGIITDSEENYLIVQLVDYSERHWNWPGGGMEGREEAEDTILRELQEELGTDKFEIIKRSSITNKYDWPNYVIAKRLKVEGKTWIGQQVVHIKLKFVGDKANIKPDPREIRQFKWITYKEIENHFVIPNQLNVAKKVLNDLNLL